MTNASLLDSVFLQARRALLLDHCFFGSLIMHLEAVEDRGAERGIWVDGHKIGYNPDAMEKIDLSARAGLLAKGVLQCALGHHLRRGSRDPKLWNKASDYVVNPEVLDSGLGLPKGALIDDQYRGKSVEQVYHLLEQQGRQQSPQGGGGGEGKASGQGGGQQPSGQGGGQQPQQGAQQSGQQSQPQKGKGGGSGQPQTGEVRDLPGEEPGQGAGDSDRSEQEREWKIILQQALQSSLSRGDLPGGFQRMIEKELQPRVSWKEELRRFMQSLGRDDLSWSRPNRHFVGQGIYLPAVHSERMGEMVVAVDTSGSIGAGALAAFEAEVNAIVEDVRPEKIHVVYCDARVGRADEYSSEDLPIKLTPVGGGGTRFEPVFDWVEQNVLGVPACLIYLTDTYGSFPQQEPDYPVMWVSVGGDQVPFGDLIKVDVSRE